MTKSEARDRLLAETGDGHYYATILRDGKKLGLLAGPFETRNEAEAILPRAKNLAMDVDQWAAFDAFGVTLMAESYTKPGKLNAMLGI